MARLYQIHQDGSRYATDINFKDGAIGDATYKDKSGNRYRDEALTIPATDDTANINALIQKAIANQNELGIDKPGMKWWTGTLELEIPGRQYLIAGSVELFPNLRLSCSDGAEFIADTPGQIMFFTRDNPVASTFSTKQMYLDRLTINGNDRASEGLLGDTDAQIALPNCRVTGCTGKRFADGTRTVTTSDAGFDVTISDATGVYKFMTLFIAGQREPKTVLDINGSVLTLDSPSDNSITGAEVSHWPVGIKGAMLQQSDFNCVATFNTVGMHLTKNFVESSGRSLRSTDNKMTGKFMLEENEVANYIGSSANGIKAFGATIQHASKGVGVIITDTTNFKLHSPYVESINDEMEIKDIRFKPMFDIQQDCRGFQMSAGNYPSNPVGTGWRRVVRNKGQNTRMTDFGYSKGPININPKRYWEGGYAKIFDGEASVYLPQAIGIDVTGSISFYDPIDLSEFHMSAINSGPTTTTSYTIAKGEITVTVPSGLRNYKPNDWIRLRNNKNNYMQGLLISYSGTSLKINMIETKGSGTYSDWKIEHTDGMDFLELTTTKTFTGYTTSSSTEHDITLGLKSFEVDAGLNYVEDDAVIISLDGSNFMLGKVNSYSGTTLATNVVDTTGSGLDNTSWTVALYYKMVYLRHRTDFAARKSSNLPVTDTDAFTLNQVYPFFDRRTGSALELQVIAAASASQAIGTGSKTFTVLSNLPSPGTDADDLVKIFDASDPDNWMTGPITSYTGITMVINATNSNGSGSFTSWDIHLISLPKTFKTQVRNIGAGIIDVELGPLEEFLGAAVAINVDTSANTTTLSNVDWQLGIEEDCDILLTNNGEEIGKRRVVSTDPANNEITVDVQFLSSLTNVVIENNNKDRAVVEQHLLGDCNFEFESGQNNLENHESLITDEFNIAQPVDGRAAFKMMAPEGIQQSGNITHWLHDKTTDVLVLKHKNEDIAAAALGYEGLKLGSDLGGVVALLKIFSDGSVGFDGGANTRLQGARLSSGTSIDSDESGMQAMRHPVTGTLHTQYYDRYGVTRKSIGIPTDTEKGFPLKYEDVKYSMNRNTVIAKSTALSALTDDEGAMSFTENGVATTVLKEFFFAVPGTVLIWEAAGLLNTKAAPAGDFNFIVRLVDQNFIETGAFALTASLAYARWTARGEIRANALEYDAATDDTFTSVSSVSINIGRKTFDVGTGKTVREGEFYIIRDDAAPGTNWMKGFVLTYGSPNVTFQVTEILGSGTLSAWTIYKDYADASVTSQPFTIGEKMFLIRPSQSYVLGDYVIIKHDDENFLIGLVTAYSGPTLTANIQQVQNLNTSLASSTTWTIGRITLQGGGNFEYNDGAGAQVNREMKDITLSQTFDISTQMAFDLRCQFSGVAVNANNIFLINYALLRTNSLNRLNI